MSSTFGVWFRQDLRLNDNRALFEAIEAAKKHEGNLVAFFHIHPELTESFTIRHDYFFQTLRDLAHRAESFGMPIHFIYGELSQALSTLNEQVPNLSSVYFNKDEVGFGAERDLEAVNWFEEEGIEVRSFQDRHIHGATEVKKDDGDHYKVFTPYFKKWQKLNKPPLYSIDHEHLKQYGRDYTEQFHEGQEHFQKMLAQCEKEWKHIGEDSASRRLGVFLNQKVDEYEEKRNLPAANATSMISPYLKNGVLSPRTIYHKIEEVREKKGDSKGLHTYLSEIAWRDYYNMIYYMYPEAKSKEIDSSKRQRDWIDDDERFLKWKNGETGFPIVDAAMRQLNSIGWMHNRLRMIVASFLSKDYLLDWRKGERYFQERLIDYDAASNIGGWQWASSTGTDAAPYFRVFNPTRQSERFDADGEFIRTYVKELKNVPKKYIHEPHKMSEEEQNKYGCVIGKDYPEPTVDHKTQRKKAIAMFESD
ncbi:deoxyribodipyrimidine photo-lyase [Pontibacillus halophilus JSM 076056 = DSM 19796]|uniref:Deoxyribodipyrimidine photo-lyase n=1 Tax=Pontibacillus halophilus JSM 076056 = DSM 19796 TaxID=1385510 RepID=A0A0A5GRD6_9BACI|nr:deoxyribodipyrimidine photo-lyase [Pontibacillus halophilus]KGX93818.1 deoxyribodipyrimidine photo-lyase [Pontibacillus halophilus JSM 076056 = DSM 19796]